jgi:hypothetical protein
MIDIQKLEPASLAVTTARHQYVWCFWSVSTMTMTKARARAAAGYFSNRSIMQIGHDSTRRKALFGALYEIESSMFRVFLVAWSLAISRMINAIKH